MTRNLDSRPRAVKRPLHQRAFALLWALVFVLGTAGEGFGLHPCPHHDGARAEAHELGTQAHHVGHGDADPVATAEDVHGGGQQTPAEEHSGPCTCGSACQAGGGVALPGPELSQPTPDLKEASPSAAIEKEEFVLPRPPFFLPFAQAPPA